MHEHSGSKSVAGSAAAGQQHPFKHRCFQAELHEGTPSTGQSGPHATSIQTHVYAIHLQAFNGVKALILSAIFTDVQLGKTIWPALQYEGPAGAGDRMPSAARQVLMFALKAAPQLHSPQQTGCPCKQLVETSRLMNLPEIRAHLLQHC